MLLFELDPFAIIVLIIFGVTAMLGVGMQATARDLSHMFGKRALIFRTFLANFVAVPIVGILLSRTLSMKPEGAIALVLLACIPGGISALQFSTKLKGAALFAGMCVLLLSFATLLISPVLLKFALPGDVSMVIPYGRLLLCILTILLLPFAVGMIVRNRWKSPAEKLSKLCMIASAVAFFVLVGLLMERRKEAMNAIGKEALIASLCFIGISMAIGWIMGGPTRETRTVVASVTGMRHAALSLIIALNTFPGGAEQNYLIAFSGLMIPPSMLLTVYMVIRMRRTVCSSGDDSTEPE